LFELTASNLGRTQWLVSVARLWTGTIVNHNSELVFLVY
jgi:hypothetical protein